VAAGEDPRRAVGLTGAGARIAAHGGGIAARNALPRGLWVGAWLPRTMARPSAQAAEQAAEKAAAQIKRAAA
jgi:hypothetical protein